MHSRRDLQTQLLRDEAEGRSTHPMAVLPKPAATEADTNSFDAIEPQNRVGATLLSVPGMSDEDSSRSLTEWYNIMSCETGDNAHAIDLEASTNACPDTVDHTRGEQVARAMTKFLTIAGIVVFTTLVFTVMLYSWLESPERFQEAFGAFFTELFMPHSRQSATDAERAYKH